MPTLDAQKNAKNSLIRKTLAGGVFAAPYGSPILDSITAGDGQLIDLAGAGFTSLGLFSREGAPNFENESEVAEVEAWGELQVAREDIVRKNMMAEFTALETNKTVLEAWLNTDLSGVEHDATTGETIFDDPVSPAVIYRQMLFIGVDGGPGSEIYIARYYPRFTINSPSGQSWDQETALEYGMSGKGLVDETSGFSLRYFFTGPGWLEIAEDAGFPEATP